jgi:hypothetical protein
MDRLVKVRTTISRIKSEAVQAPREVRQEKEIAREREVLKEERRKAKGNLRENQIVCHGLLSV